jgi:hypothetical protein
MINGVRQVSGIHPRMFIKNIIVFFSRSLLSVYFIKQEADIEAKETLV